jgi:hypothetical protein
VVGTVVVSVAVIGVVAWQINRPTGIEAFDHLKLGMTKAETEEVMGGKATKENTDKDGRSQLVWMLNDDEAVVLTFNKDDALAQRFLINPQSPSFLFRLRLTLGW